MSLTLPWWFFNLFKLEKSFMSGVKRVNVIAGATPTSEGVLLAAGGIIAATGAVISGGATVAKAVVKAAQAHQERVRQERERAVQRERDIQKRIAEIRAKVGSHTSRKRTAVKVPEVSVAPPTNLQKGSGAFVQSQKPDVGAKHWGNHSSMQPKVDNPHALPSSESLPTGPNYQEQDHRRRVQDLQSRLPGIKREYETLVAQELLEPATVSQALAQTQQALHSGNLTGAQACLKALDDARIQALEELQASQRVQAEFAQERLDALSDRLPQAFIQQLNMEIEGVRNNGAPPDDPDLMVLHQKLSEGEAQVERVVAAANHLLNAWTEVGYVAHFAGIDNGDLILSVETHEGANTQIRVEFEGQQIVLDGPSEETVSCSARTREVLQLFQQQGYYLEWESLDGQPVPEEWRTYYSATAETPIITENKETTSPSNQFPDYAAQQQRRLEAEEY
ncbi:MAG: hypothetical protein F6K47_10080 [Symploca sp. SIO2E6]|nr:hypothetical protein [Symploca sp. SIO2E6]